MQFAGSQATLFATAVSYSSKLFIAMVPGEDEDDGEQLASICAAYHVAIAWKVNHDLKAPQHLGNGTMKNDICLNDILQNDIWQNNTHQNDTLQNIIG
jgi:hypothetical protein